MAEADDTIEITTTTKIKTTIQKNASLLVTITVGAVSPAFPIYAIITGGELKIPLSIFAVILTLSIIGSLIIYYEAKIKEIKDSPLTILQQKYANGGMKKELFLEKMDALEKYRKK